MSRLKYVIGIDEVGRGALAGPVTVAALALPRGFRNKSGLPLIDSKKLLPAIREAWYAHLKKSPEVLYAVSHVQPAIIDRINISNAANLAAYRVVQKLATNHLGLATGVNVFLDGGLYARNSIKKLSFPCISKTVVKGDEKIPAIALASIIAKVRRDALMKRLHKKYSRYGFAIHKGYGTKKHKAAIKKYGPSVAHRVSFWV